MRILAIIIVKLILSLTINAQTITIENVKNSPQGVCVKEHHTVSFSSNKYTRVNHDNNSRVSGPCKLSSTGYEDSGEYFEIWSSRFYLDEFGVIEYQKVNQYTVKVVYDKRGGDVLYLLETSTERRNYPPKVLNTAKGSEKYCR